LDLNAIFEVRKPSDQDLENIQLIRMSALEFARAVRDCTPGSEEQRIAIHKIREAVMWANAGVVLKGRI